MGITIKSKLESLSNKISNMSNSLEVDRVAEALAERGKDIAEALYSSNNVQVSRTEVRNGQAEIIASGKAVAYMEFGTGETGRGTYEGNLPTQTLVFESPKGKPQSTQGWVYNYPNRYTKLFNGWFFGKTFTTGQPAQAQMFKTHRQLQNEYVDIAKSVIKGEKK